MSRYSIGFEAMTRWLDVHYFWISFRVWHGAEAPKLKTLTKRSQYAVMASIIQ